MIEEDEPPRTRPFVVTQGQTTTQASVRLETLVEATDPQLPARFERKELRDMAADTPISVAELSAHLKLPIGTTMTLVSQMIDEGLLSAHATVTTSDEPTSTAQNIDIMTRIINRVRDL